MGGFIRIFGSTFEVAFHPKTKKELESDAVELPVNPRIAESTRNPDTKCVCAKRRKPARNRGRTYQPDGRENAYHPLDFHQ